MIRLFDRSETNFNHNKNILNPISCEVFEEENGMFEIEMELPKGSVVDIGQIVKAPTPRGEEVFRIYRNVPSLKGRKIYAKHLFYDLVNNFIINNQLSGVTCSTAIQNLLSSAEYDSGFTASSNISGLKDISFTKVNLVQAILGDSGIVDVFGGYLVRTGKTINIKSSGLDRGYEVRLGKNLIGIECDYDESNVITRQYPTAEKGDGIIMTLPEKYVDSPLLGNYGDPRIVETKVTLSEEEKLLSDSEIFTIMRNYCTLLYNAYNIDKPTTNYKIDFVELSKTEQYKNLAILEQLDLYDIVTVNVSDLNIDLKSKVVKYKYDSLKQRYISIELGNFKNLTNYQTNAILDIVSKKIDVVNKSIYDATNVITGNNGGYVVIRRYADGKPYEILVMDTEDINTADNVLRINNSGIGFSRTGYNGSYSTAMTIDGHIVADYVDTGVLNTNVLATNTITADKLLIGDFTNYATANELFSKTMIPTSVFGGCVTNGTYIAKSVATNQFLMLCNYTLSSFKQGDIIYFEMIIKGATNGSINVSLWGYNNSFGNISSATYGITKSITTTETTISGNIVLNNVATNTASYFLVGINDINSTKSQIYVRNVKFIRKTGGQLIAGNIQSDNYIADTTGTQLNLTNGKLTINDDSTYNGARLLVRNSVNNISNTIQSNLISIDDRSNTDIGQATGFNIYKTYSNGYAQTLMQANQFKITRFGVGWTADSYISCNAYDNGNVNISVVAGASGAKGSIGADELAIGKINTYLGASLEIRGYNNYLCLRSFDSWLRINDTSPHTSGVYFGSSIVRTDGQLQVGGSGSAFYANSSGDVYAGNNIKAEGYFSGREGLSGNGNSVFRDSPSSTYIGVGIDGTGQRIFSPAFYSRTYSSGATVTVTSEGTLGRISSATKYKLDIKPVQEVSKAILDLQPKSWFDKSASEAYADYLTDTCDINIDGSEKEKEIIDIESVDIPVLERCYGLIAEDVEDVGLGKYVLYGYNKDGTKEVESLQYERMWIDLIPIIKEQQQRLEVLENKLK